MAVTISERTHTSVRKVTFAWTSAADGSAGGSGGGGRTTAAFDGKLERLVTVPGAAAAAPTDNYDITITDEDGVDALLGAGANRDTANTEQVAAASLGIVAGDRLTLNVTNAGDSKSGTVHLYIR